MCFSCCDSCFDKCRRKQELRPRTIWVGRPLKADQKSKFPPNKIRNQKYNIITFIPMVSLDRKTFVQFLWSILHRETRQFLFGSKNAGVCEEFRVFNAANLPENALTAQLLFLQVLYQQFKFFLNFYFLVMACSQFIPSIRVGYLYTYWLPLVSAEGISLHQHFRS